MQQLTAQQLHNIHGGLDTSFSQSLLAGFSSGITALAINAGNASNKGASLFSNDVIIPAFGCMVATTGVHFLLSAVVEHMVGGNAMPTIALGAYDAAYSQEISVNI